VNNSSLVAWCNRHNIYYGWVVVAVMFVSLSVFGGFIVTFDHYNSALLERIGRRAAAATEVDWFMVIGCAGSVLLSGYLFDRVGARVLLSIGALVLGVGLVICSTVATSAVFSIVYGILACLTYATFGIVPHMAIVPHWFTRQRGLAYALLLGGAGLGIPTIMTVVQGWAYSIGWQETMWWLGIASIFVLIPINIVFHRHDAESVGLQINGTDSLPSANCTQSVTQLIVNNGSATIGQALRTRAFWLLTLAATMAGVCIIILIEKYRVGILEHVGNNLSLASRISAALASVIGCLILGPLSDRFGRAVCAVIICGLSLVGLALLWLASVVPSEPTALREGLITGFLLTYGLAFNGGIPVYASAVSDHFMGRNLGTIFGFFAAGFLFGFALGLWWIDWLLGQYDSYGGVILSLTVCMVMASFGLWAATRERYSSAIGILHKE
jgi:MFS family permease